MFVSSSVREYVLGSLCVCVSVTEIVLESFCEEVCVFQYVFLAIIVICEIFCGCMNVRIICKYLLKFV